MLSIRSALELMLPHFAPVRSERLPLAAATGRVLARDLYAQYELPEFTHSAMDGYAVRYADLSMDVTLPVQGESRAGGGLPPALSPMTAMRILTGAPMPDGADTVIMQENVARTGVQLRVLQLPRQGANVRLRGSDVRPGERLVANGTALGPGEVGLLAAQGCAHVDINARPRVAILTTGDELREVDAPRVPATIVNSNGLALAAAVLQAGCEAELLPIAADRADDIARQLKRGLGADVMLTVGGVSVGDYDLVSHELRAAGVDIAFHKVAIKPGKPLLFGLHGARPVVGLPGNPVSALVTFYVFIRPCLLRMQGHREIYAETLDVLLAEPYRRTAGRTELARARVSRTHGAWVAHLHAAQGSGSLQSLVAQDVLVILPAEREQFAAGETLRALRIGDARSAACPFDG